MCFGNIRVVVPCGDGDILVKDLIREATLRYKKATGKVSFVCIFASWFRLDRNCQRVCLRFSPKRDQRLLDFDAALIVF